MAEATDRQSPALLAMIRIIDGFTDRTGTIISWLAVPLVLAVAYEVGARYLFNAPTVWAYDATYMLYGSLFMMGSNGGLLSAERTCRQPIGLVESGPIGGCIGAGAYAEALGFKNLISLDMGGTTAKCALVENGRFSVNSVYYANGYIKGFPIKSAVIDIVEVG